MNVSNTPQLLLGGIHEGKQQQWSARVRSFGKFLVSHMIRDDIITSSQRDDLAPRPVPENLCQLRTIAADISRATDQSPYVSTRVKANLRECTRDLEAECAKLEHLTQLAHRAAHDASNVLRWRIRFFDALDDRIQELSQLRSRFVDSRRAFHEQPNSLLTGEIRSARGRIHTGMLSGVKPLFDKIDKYYSEVNVSLRVEEECLRKIRSSLRVTPDDRSRWEHIRDACNEAFNLLATGVSATLSRMSSTLTSDN